MRAPLGPPLPVDLPVAALGRALQLFGLLLLPAALLYGATAPDRGAVGVELTALAVGALAFFLGTKLLGRRE